MSVEGSLDLFGLPDLLQMISQQGKTGILTIQGQQDIVAVSFLSGRIVAADSLGHTVEEGLSQVLVSEGLMTAAAFARVNAENQAKGGRLLDFLVDGGYLSRPQLLAALRSQTVRQLGALLHWREGDFKFYSGDEVSYEEGFDPISVEDFLLRSLSEFPAPPPAVPPTPAPAALPGGPPAAGTGGSAPRGRRGGALARGDSGELRLPEVPELPEVMLPELHAALIPPAPPSLAQRTATAPLPPLAAPPPGTADPRGGGGGVRGAAAGARPAGARTAAPLPSSTPLPWPAAAITPPPAPPSPPRPRAAEPVGRAAPSPFVPPAAAAAAAASGEAAALPRQFRQMRVERQDRAVPAGERLVVGVLALAIVALVAIVVRQAPSLLVLPFPWQQGDRGAFLRNQREALYDKIDVAAKTAFLRDGRFPDRLDQLVEAHLLAPADLFDPTGQPLRYTAREDSYLLQANAAGQPIADSEASESIGGNFLLDPNLKTSDAAGPPVVLLD